MRKLHIYDKGEKFNDVHIVDVETGIDLASVTRRVNYVNEVGSIPLATIEVIVEKFDAIVEGKILPDVVDMILHCPVCGEKHVDAPQGHDFVNGECKYCHVAATALIRLLECNKAPWQNPPHKSHLCHSCGCIWRPSDTPTNGVAKIKTRGAADNWVGEPT